MDKNIDALRNVVNELVRFAEDSSQFQITEVGKQIQEQLDNENENMSFNKISRTISKKASGRGSVSFKIPTLESLSPGQVINRNLRYPTNGLFSEDFKTSIENDEKYNGSGSIRVSATSLLVRHTSSLFRSTNSSTESRDYEDVTSPQILRAPITDICIIEKGELVPPHFYRISRTISNKNANLNTQTGGHELYLCIRKMASQEDPCLTPYLTSIFLVFPDKNEFVPPGFFVAKRGGIPCNLNSTTSGDRVILCFKKERLGNPIVDLQLLFLVGDLQKGKNDNGQKGSETLAPSFSLIETSPTGIPANINLGSNSRVKIFLGYRLRLLRLQCLLKDENHDISVSRKNMNKNEVEHDEKEDEEKEVPDQNEVDGNQMTSEDDEWDLLPDQIEECPNIDKKEHQSSKKEEIIMESEDDEYNNDFSNLSNKDPIKEEESNPRIANPLSFFHEEEEGEWNEETIESILNRSIYRCDGVTSVSPALRFSFYVLLSSLYVRQGEIAHASLLGLCNLLKESNVFSSDLALDGLSHKNLTLLDLSIEVVCDRFDQCVESETHHYLGFFHLVIKHSRGRLCSESLQRMFKSLSFLCSYASTRHHWFTLGHGLPHDQTGAELACFRVLKELTWTIVGQTESLPLSQFFPTQVMQADAVEFEKLTSKHLESGDLDNLLVTDEVKHVIELANNAVSKHQLFKHVKSSRNSFWNYIVKLSSKLFSDSHRRSAFVTICALCKLASHQVRPELNAIPRDLGSKLLALDAMIEFCSCAGEKMRHCRIMGFVVRRIVISCLLNNLSTALYDRRLFSKLLRLLTSLWKSWRVHIKIEFASICDNFIIPILNSRMQVRPIMQMLVLKEASQWLEQPGQLLEMFINYDLDVGGLWGNWKIFADLMQAICAIARRAAINTGAWDWQPSTLSSSASLMEILSSKTPITARDTNLQAIEEVSNIAKTLMDAIGHGFIDSLPSDQFFGGDTLHVKWTLPTSQINTSNGPSVLKTEDIVNNNTEKDEINELFLDLSISDLQARRQDFEQLLASAVRVYREKSLTKALRLLSERGLLGAAPKDTAAFLRVHRALFDASAVGDALGEGGLNAQEQLFWREARYHFTRASCFVGLELVRALRLFLTGCGFRLPGEGQKVDRFVEAFQRVFWEDNCHTHFCPFKSPDTVHLLTYAVIMLNTDLHRAHDDKAKKTSKKIKKMTKDEFISNLRGVDNGSDINKEYLSEIYESIASEPIELAVESTEISQNGQNGQINPPTERQTSRDSSHGNSSPAGVASSSGGNNGKEGEKGESLFGAPLTQGDKNLAREMTRAAQETMDVLRLLSKFAFSSAPNSATARPPARFVSVGARVPPELVRALFGTVSFILHATTEQLLSCATLDPPPDNRESRESRERERVLEGDGEGALLVSLPAMDALCFCLGAALLLGAQNELLAFAEQLRSVARSSDGKGGFGASGGSVEASEQWFAQLEECPRAQAVARIGEVQAVCAQLKDGLRTRISGAATRRAAALIEKRARVIEENAFFVRAGELAKVSRSGRRDAYTFFLFSHFLYYCHRASATGSVTGNGLNGSGAGEFRVHLALDLARLNVGDVDEPSGRSLQLLHPLKSFVAVAPSVQEKLRWLRDLRAAADESLRRSERQGVAERRLSLVDRLLTQRSSQQSEKARRNFFSAPALFRSNRAMSLSNNNSNSNHIVSSASANSVNVSSATGPPVVSPNSHINPLFRFSHSNNSNNNYSGNNSNYEGEARLSMRSNRSSLSLPEPLTKDNNFRSSRNSTPSRALRDSVDDENDGNKNGDREGERAAASTRFRTRLNALDNSSLANLFKAGEEFWRSLLEARVVAEGSRARLCALAKLVKDGKFNESGESESDSGSGKGAKSEEKSPVLLRAGSGSSLAELDKSAAVKQAWREVSRTLEGQDARMFFLAELFDIAPYWKYEQFL